MIHLTKRPFILKKHDMVDDPNASSRKSDHINLTFQSQTNKSNIDSRFYYEPLFQGHPSKDIIPKFELAKKIMNAPIWISSMTGGTQYAKKINENLARACGSFGLGMGLGSCRGLLESNEHFEDFNVRKFLPNQPLFANLGIAQLEKLILQKKLNTVKDLVDRLAADGLIIHVNPLQEYFQPEGDKFRMSPIQIIEDCCQHFNFPLIVKEVGHGFGPKSLLRLLQLPLEAVDFGAAGGTNFSSIELKRLDNYNPNPLELVGHSAEEMIEFCNFISSKNNITTKKLIISGGVKDSLDGYYLIGNSNLPAIYGQAANFLKQALIDLDTLEKYVDAQLQNLAMAYAYLTVKKSKFE